MTPTWVSAPTPATKRRTPGASPTRCWIRELGRAVRIDATDRVRKAWRVAYLADGIG